MDARGISAHKLGLMLGAFIRGWHVAWSAKVWSGATCVVVNGPLARA